MINEEKILTLIGQELQSILSDDTETFKGYSFEICNEQMFMKKDLKKCNSTIFIVIKYYPATLNYGQILLPIQIDVVSEPNKLEVAKRLLCAFAETYNLEFDNEMTIKQYFQSPTVLSNFNEVGYGYRSVLTMRGTLQISENSNLIKSISIVGGTELEPTYDELGFITSNVSFDVQLETQSMYGEDNVTKSWARVGTLVLNFSVYLTNDDFCNTILYIISKNTTNAPNGISTPFKMRVLFKNGIEILQTFTLANATLQQNIGEYPVINLTFTL